MDDTTIPTQPEAEEDIWQAFARVLAQYPDAFKETSPLLSKAVQVQCKASFLAGVAHILKMAEEIAEDMEDGPHNSYYAGMKEGMMSLVRELRGELDVQ